MRSNHRVWCCAIAVASFFGVSARSDAAVTLSLSDAVGDPSSSTIVPGGAVTLTVTLVSDQPFTGITFFLQAPGAGSSQFSITGRSTAAGNPLSDPTSTNPQITAAASALLDPTNNSDLGYTAADVFTNIPAGTYEIGTLTVTSKPTIAGGAYSLAVTGGVIFDADFNEAPITGGSYTVTAAIPEAGVSGAVAASGIAMLARRRRVAI